MAKASASDAGWRVPAAALQVHGGIGFTWEHDVHWLKRGKADATCWARARAPRAGGGPHRPGLVSPPMRRRTWLALAGLAALLAPAAARADIFAAVQVAAPAPRTDFDIAVLNASTGARVALPAGTNTAAQETHPSITIDGRRLVFERSDPAAGTVRIIAADLTTSQSADLFNGFEVAQRAPSDPAILPSSSVVYTGGPFLAVSGGGFSMPVVSTALSNFPAGPFPRSTIEQQYDFLANGSLQDLAAGGALIAFQETRTGFHGELVLRQLGGTASFPLANGQTTFANPNMAASNPEIVVFDQRSVSGAAPSAPATSPSARRRRRPSSAPRPSCRRSSTRRGTSRSPR